MAEYSRIQIWLLAARPKTLPAGAVPVVIGAAVAYGTGVFHWPSFLCALLGSVLIQIGANFSNDLFDHIKKTDDADRIGPLRVTQAGLVTPGQMKVATILVFLAALVIGIYLVYRGGWPILVIGLSSILFAILYTAGPRPLGYIGLGDLFVLTYYGPVAVAGTFYVITLDVTTSAILAGIPPGMFSTAILTVNNLRDIESDRRTGKRTLAVRFGRTFARIEYLVMLFGACLFPVILHVMYITPAWSMISLATIVVSIPTVRKILTQTSGEILNDALAETGRLLIIYGVLFSIGWLL